MWLTEYPPQIAAPPQNSLSWENNQKCPPRKPPQSRRGALQPLHRRSTSAVSPAQPRPPDEFANFSRTGPLRAAVAEAARRPGILYRLPPRPPQWQRADLVRFVTGRAAEDAAAWEPGLSRPFPQRATSRSPGRTGGNGYMSGPAGTCVGGLDLSLTARISSWRAAIFSCAATSKVEMLIIYKVPNHQPAQASWLAVAGRAGCGRGLTHRSCQWPRIRYRRVRCYRPPRRALSHTPRRQGRDRHRRRHHRRETQQRRHRVLCHRRPVTSRSEFLDALTAALTKSGIICRRYLVEPAGPEDLEISVEGVVHRLRIVRTGMHPRA